MMYNSIIPIVIPSYEPDSNLIGLCNNLVNNNLNNIIIVDDGSGVEFRDVFDKAEKEYNCTVIRHEVNLGKGRALKDAFKYILDKFENVIGCITADSDGQHTPKDIKKCMDALIEYSNALVLGCRDFSGDDVPKKSKFGNELTKKVCGFLCGIKVSDTQTGLRGIPRDMMKDLLEVPGERFEFETNMLINCKDKTIIKEVPIETVYDSKENHKTHFDPVKDSIKIYKIFGKLFLKYIFSSLSSCAIDLLLFSLFCSISKSWNVSIYVFISTVLARVISATYNYLINYKLVFKSQEKHSSSSIKYFILAIAQMSLSALFVTLGVKVFSLMPETGIKIIVDTILFFLSYYIQRKYVF